VLVLANANFEIPRHKVTYITGPSGAGKSTILKLLYGNIFPTSGDVFFAKVPTSEISKDKLQLVRSRCGFIFQDSYMIPDLTIYENILLPHKLRNLDNDKVFDKLFDLCNYLDVVKILERRPYQVSEGERQRAGVIRAIASRPPIIIADEPTGNIDDEFSKRIFILLNELADQGSTVVCATHDSNITGTPPPGTLKVLNLKVDVI